MTYAFRLHKLRTGQNPFVDEVGYKLNLVVDDAETGTMHMLFLNGEHDGLTWPQTEIPASLIDVATLQQLDRLALRMQQLISTHESRATA